MATVELESHRGKVCDLPEICMRCGAPSTVIRLRKFAWQPPWVIVLLLAGLLPYLIVAIILTKRARVEVPLCDRHKNNWLWRLLFLLGGPLVLVGGGTVLWVILRNIQGIRDDANFLWLLIALLFVLWLITAAIMESISIRPSEITDTTITLGNIAKQFRDAYEEELDASERELDKHMRQRWRDRDRRGSDSIRRRPRDDFDEDEDRPDSFRQGER